ncbi:DUF3631 domain-containing protein [Nocardia vulneris]|uniref:DUF3631 domain-containing protein n=1 Tax=Nocardia vulneris TaxID=1141657 RepID=A0ABR4Z4M3_9NOCA|nr:DUF3631 domain-containing protein [Nocardia vulneris]KIA60251.1 hypothetical protein FG87_38225 [Nocardia vulneris]
MSNVLPMHGDLQPDPALAAALDEIEQFFARYTVLPDDHCYSVLALWAAHTWVSDIFYVTPRLILDSPEPGSGKTRVLELLHLLCHRPMFTFSTTPSALYRSISMYELSPTILQDEADAVFGRGSSQTQDIRALFNAGYKRGATVQRSAKGEDGGVENFEVFAPVALAGIAGNMPDTITSRSITIHMRRRRASDHVEPFRERHAAAATAGFRREFQRWAFDSPAGQRQALAHHEPVVPEGVRDRAAEIWEPLLTVADNAGSHWSRIAREACEYFVLHREDPTPVSPGVQLLRDLYRIFDGQQQMHTKDILPALYDLEEGGEWVTYQRGGALTARQMAELLSRYGVQRKTLKVRGVAGKGYVVQGDTGLGQAWERYVENG